MAPEPSNEMPIEVAGAAVGGPQERLPCAAAAPGVAAAAVTSAGEGQCHAAAAAGGEDPNLSELSLPAAVIRRAARSAAPGVHFSKEAIAALHRVAQAYICFATDGALREVQAEADKVRKAKGKINPMARKSLGADHVMRFLTAELPPIAKKVAILFPDLMPSEFKPAGIRLLEQLQEQEKAADTAAPAPAAGAAAAAEAAGAPPPPSGPAALLAAFAAAAPPVGEPGGGPAEDEDAQLPFFSNAIDAGEEGPAKSDASAKAVKEPLAEQPKRKRGAADREESAKKHAKVSAAAPLERFFGKRAVASVEAPMVTPTCATSQAGPAIDAEPAVSVALDEEP
mmetsp:Transcript_118026/g.328952  ORF Transcript_118026/g.328952 Transcript_118026/m.328952 type:complete len:340 (-) Transcript_118026:61-1080(-)